MTLVALFALMGVAIIWLGIKGQAGKVDYAMAAYTRESSEPGKWQEAHELTGRANIFGGALFIVGSAIFGLASLIGAAEWVIGLAIVVPSVVATVIILGGVFRGLSVLSGGQLPPEQRRKQSGVLS